MTSRRDGRQVSTTRAGLLVSPVVVLLCAVPTLAKDRPPKPEPEKAVTGCEYLGKGYVKPPGSDTCIKVSGSSRSEGAAIFGR